MNQYAIYKGENLLFIGTPRQCAAHLGIKLESIYWLSSPANHRRDKGNRKIVIKLEDE
jgi:hypothetical protein